MQNDNSKNKNNSISLDTSDRDAFVEVLEEEVIANDNTDVEVELLRNIFSTGNAKLNLVSARCIFQCSAIRFSSADRRCLLTCQWKLLSHAFVEFCHCTW